MKKRKPKFSDIATDIFAITAASAFVGLLFGSTLPTIKTTILGLVIGIFVGFVLGIIFSIKN